MSNPENDSRLEQLSREAADRYTVKASPSWDKMEKELDKVLPTDKKKRRPFLFWWIIPGILIGGSILWYTLHTPESNLENTGAAIVTSTPNKESIIESNKNIKQQKIASIPFQSADTEQKHSPVIDAKREESSSYLSKTSQQLNSAIAQNKGLSNQPKKTGQAPPGISSLQKEVILASASTSSTSTEYEQITHSTTDTGNNVSDNGIHTTKNSMLVSLNYIEEPITVKTQDSIIPKNKKEKSAFSWALVAGIDATTVKFRYADKASLSGGIMIGYHFNRNWSIHTGALYTRKNYKMAGSDFKAPLGSWVANYKLETVDGFCNMWEIPLLVRYTFDAQTKNKAFISGGLSSYLMTRENYNYFYYYNGLPVRRNVNYPDGKTHPFSILKLSAGWIREVNKKASLIVEPFANLPLSGLGFGSAKLSSFGIHFSYQFRQPNKKK